MSRKAQGGQRQLKVKLKKSSGRTVSSKRWLERQLNDPYVTAAKREGYRSRAAFKLLEIAGKYNLLNPGDAVIDLGAAPGGWSQIAADRVKSQEGAGFVVALDILPMEPVPGVITLQGDFGAPGAGDRVMAALGGRRPDIVLSDMAAPATGHPKTDHLRIIGLAEEALDFAMDVLAPGGAFLAKVFQGGSEKTLLDAMKRNFAVVRHVKPAASRAESAELYVLATGFKGRTQTQDAL